MEKRSDKGKAAKRQYINKYNAATYKQVIVRLHTINDRDILDQLNNVKSKADYIRQLIREDIKNCRP